jgi:hypothetical protein
MSIFTQHAPPEARDTVGFAGGIAALAEGKLYALQNSFALDGRVGGFDRAAARQNADAKLVCGHG